MAACSSSIPGTHGLGGLVAASDALWGSEQGVCRDRALQGLQRAADGHSACLSDTADMSRSWPSAPGSMSGSLHVWAHPLSQTDSHIADTRFDILTSHSQTTHPVLGWSSGSAVWVECRRACAKKGPISSSGNLAAAPSLANSPRPPGSPHGWSWI